MPHKDKEAANAWARRRYAERADVREKRAKSSAAWKAANPDVGRKASLAWYHRNADEVKARKRAEYAENREAQIARTKAWQAANPERTREIYERWRAENREKYLAAARRWAKAHPEKVREYTNRRRAQKLATEIEPIDEIAVFDRDEWVCQLCLFFVDRNLAYPDPDSASLDHIVPLSKGGTHTLDNVQLAHLSCNVSKGNRPHVRVGEGVSHA